MWWNSTWSYRRWHPLVSCDTVFLIVSPSRCRWYSLVSCATVSLIVSPSRCRWHPLLLVSTLEFLSSWTQAVVLSTRLFCIASLSRPGRSSRLLNGEQWGKEWNSTSSYRRWYPLVSCGVVLSIASSSCRLWHPLPLYSKSFSSR